MTLLFPASDGEPITPQPEDQILTLRVSVLRKENPVQFRVFGTPKPGGSKRGFVIPGKNGAKPRANVVEDCKKNANWREAVKAAALSQVVNSPLLDGPLLLIAEFIMPRPKGHFRGGRNAHLLKPNAPRLHTIKPDSTKLLRSTEDALTGVVWTDDSQIAQQFVEKRYACPGERPGALITISPINEGFDA